MSLQWGVGDVAQVIDCEHKTAPRTQGERYGYSISTREVRNGRISLDDAKPVDKKTFDSWTQRAIPSFGDLIFSREAPMGEVGAAPSTERVCLGQRTVLLRPNPNRIDHRYLLFALMAPVAQQWIRDNALGSTVQHLNVADVRRVPLGPARPLDEQRRIVDLLEDHLSRLDAAASLLDASSRRSRTLEKSVLLDLIPDLSTYPVHWQSVTVADAGLVELGRQRHPDWHTGDNMRPYLRVANVFEDRIDTTDVMEMHWPGESFDRFKLALGDVLLNEGQSPEWLGRPAIYRGAPEEVAFTNSLIRFRARSDVLPEFALLVFRRHMHAGRFMRESRITTNIAHLSAARLKAVEFPIPPLREQAQIVTRADERLGAVEQMRTGIKAAKTRSASLRRALLAAAFSGRLTGRSSELDLIEEEAS